MEKTKGFYDFCIPYQDDKIAMIKIVKEAYNLGYRTVAIEQTLEYDTAAIVKWSGDVFPAPVDISFLDELKGKMTILHRLTIVYLDVAIAHAMSNSQNLKKYHLVAGRPMTDSARDHCCTTFNGDIISNDPGKPFIVGRKSYQLAVRRGMCFEIKYADAIRNSTHLKEMIKTAHNYHAKGKSKNVIFTSGATTEFDLRGPYDIANLALIFGLTEEQGKAAVNNTCRTLFLKAESRRLGKTIMFVKQTGPTILSSSSDESDSDDDDEQDDAEGKANEEKDDNMENEDISEQQPHKKKKLF